MPPRIPGTLSNGVMSLKFMQRAFDQKPVQAEAAEILDDSKWVIARSTEEDEIARSSISNRGFEVTYEPSYIPFIFDEGSTSSKPVKGRRTFGSGKDVEEAQNITKAELASPLVKEDDPSSDEELDYGPSNSSPQPDIKPPLHKPNISTSASTTQLTTSSTSQPSGFLRPAGVDVPKANPVTTGKASGMSRRDPMTAMIASSKAKAANSDNATSSSTIDSKPSTRNAADRDFLSLRSEEGSGARRKAVDDGDRPKKKVKKQKAGLLS